MPDAHASAHPSRFRAWPKADLHLHAMGAIRPDTIVELARRRSAPILGSAERGAAEGYAFTDLPGFVEFFIGLFELVVDGGSFERIAYELLEDAAADGVHHVEFRLTPTSHLHRGADEKSMFEGLVAGRRAAHAAYGITSRIVVDFPRSLPLAIAEENLRVALAQRSAGVVGFDIAGDESAVACPAAFSGVFRHALEEGLQVTAHAGEAAGAASVRDAVDRYGAGRIGHGTRAIEDTELVRHLAAAGVVLEVCPSSNVALGVVPSVVEHPVRDFLAAGLPCVVATDDPTLFATTLSEEYRRLSEEAGLTDADLGAMARRSFEAAFVEDGPSGEELRGRLATSARGVPGR